LAGFLTAKGTETRNAKNTKASAEKRKERGELSESGFTDFQDGLTFRDRVNPFILFILILTMAIL